MWDTAIAELNKDERNYKSGQPLKMPLHAAQIGAANFLAEIIDNKNIGPVVFGMNWSRIDLSKSSLQLLTSDRPIDMPLGLKEPNAYIALPVSPRNPLHRSPRPWDCEYRTQNKPH